MSDSSKDYPIRLAMIEMMILMLKVRVTNRTGFRCGLIGVKADVVCWCDDLRERSAALRRRVRVGTMYYIDADAVGLDALQARLQGTDLIPSHLPLLEGIAENMALLSAAGIGSLGDLQVVLKTAKSASELASRCDVERDYLMLLRRVINGFFPKPKPLADLDWLDTEIIDKLARAGVANTQQLFDAAMNSVEFCAKVGISERDLRPFIEVADLCRVQWVSPTFARAIIAAGIAGAEDVKNADPEALCASIVRANKVAGFNKGKVGLRDVKRLVVAAEYVG